MISLIEVSNWRRALLWLLLLGPFFFASYGFATWVTSQRSDIGVIVFDWERHIPFVPWTIIPYWLIDLLYGISLFLCTTKIELDNHGKRLLTAQVVAVTCFLLFPLQFSYSRPESAGMFGWLFQTLALFDKPYNQAPSLHIALMVLLWVVYARALPAHWRWLVHGVFSLIGISVLTTWQHHFIDVPTGLALGFFCLWLFPDQLPAPWRTAQWSSDPVRQRLALRYGAGALAAAFVALYFGGTALWLLWLCLALLWVAAAYAWLGEAAFQKRADGQMSLAVRWLLVPYLLAAKINARLWTRGLNAADDVLPGVQLGRLPQAGDAQPEAIIDISAELPFACNHAGYRNVPVLDLVPPTHTQISDAVSAIEQAYVECRAKGGTVLVCCALGFSRSALALAAWLLHTQRAATPALALAQIRQARPAIVLSPAHLATLQGWWEQEQNGG